MYFFILILIFHGMYIYMTNQNPKLKVILKSEVKVFHLSTSHRFLTSITDILSNAFSRFQLK